MTKNSFKKVEDRNFVEAAEISINTFLNKTTIVLYWQYKPKLLKSFLQENYSNFQVLQQSVHLLKNAKYKTKAVIYNILIVKRQTIGFK